MAPTSISKTLAVAACAIMFSAPSVHAQCVIARGFLTIEKPQLKWSLEVQRVETIPFSGGIMEFRGRALVRVPHIGGPPRPDIRIRSESISGWVNGRQFSMNVAWKSITPGIVRDFPTGRPPQTERYTGIISDPGIVRGGAAVLLSGNIRSTWTTPGETLSCGARFIPRPPRGTSSLIHAP